jgi:hypothetical protein
MNSDLEHIIALQKLDSAAHDAQHRVAEVPEREKALDARIEAARERVASAKARLAESQTARRDIEKEVAVHQGRLSKFREQGMAVKTNQEYTAIQHEIGYAQGEIKTLEDKVLERMLEADELTAAAKRAEADLAAEQKAVDADRKAMAADVVERTAALGRISAERDTLVKTLDPAILTMFEQVKKKRNGVAMSEARDGICTICHVRLRPQVFNTVRRNDAIIQCDHCNRILYFVPLTATAPAPATQP